MAPKNTCKECGKVTLHISWSRLRTHEECKQRNFLKMERKSAPQSNQRVFFAGTVTDRVVRDWLENDPYSNPKVMPGMVEEVINREKKSIEERGGVMTWHDSQDRNRVLEECIEAVTKIEPVLEEKVLPFEYKADFSFKAPVLMPHPDGGMDTAILNGFIDIIVFDPATGKWSVYDVKHTKDNQYFKKTMGQLGFYDFANFIREGEYTSEVALLQPLCKEEVKVIPLDLQTRTVMMRRIASMAHDVWSEERAPRKDTKMCGFCDVKHACTKFTPTIAPDGKRRMSFSR